MITALGLLESLTRIWASVFLFSLLLRKPRYVKPGLRTSLPSTYLRSTTAMGFSLTINWHGRDTLCYIRTFLYKNLRLKNDKISDIIRHTQGWEKTKNFHIGYYTKSWKYFVSWLMFLSATSPVVLCMHNFVIKSS